MLLPYLENYLNITHDQVIDFVISEGLTLEQNRTNIDNQLYNIIKDNFSGDPSDARMRIANKINEKTKTFNYILYGIHSHSRNQFYLEIDIPKRNGKIRKLHAVKGGLKTIQEKTYGWLAQNYEPTKFALGFKTGGGIIENAKLHRNKRVIIKIDLKDFFPSITFARVVGMFQAYPFGLPKNDSIILGQICCLDGNGPIPQGGITSPYISNMICRKLDKRLSKFGQKEGFTYSRYADDITFSSDKKCDYDKILGWATQIIENEHFIVNDKKTRILDKSKRQTVTGIVVNDGLNVNRRYVRRLKALLHNCEKYGIISQIHTKKFKDPRNTCSNVYMNQSGNYYRYGYKDPIKEEIKEDKKKTIEKQVIELFFSQHIRGMIEFVGQVAKANKDLDDRNYQSRIKIYNDLIKQWTAVAQKERIEQPLKYMIGTYLREIKNHELINTINDADMQELDNICNENPRTFGMSFDRTNIEEYKKSLINILQYPDVDIQVLKTLLRDTTDSRTNALGKLIHSIDTKNPLYQRELFIYHREYLKKRFHITSSLRETFDKILSHKKDSAMQCEGFKYKENEIVDFFGDESIYNKYILPFKKAVRFGQEEEATSLKGVLDSILNNEAIKRRITDKKIEVSCNTLKTVYTDVNAVKNALKTIIESMVKNTQGTKVNINFNRNIEGETVITISDNNDSEINADCDKNNLVNGKLRKAIFTLNGIGQYYFIANFNDYGWRAINMFETNSVSPIEPHEGVTHKIILHSIK